MSIADKIAWDDTLLPFQLDRADVRGRVVRLDAVLEEILCQHTYPPAVASLVAEAVMLAALIGHSAQAGWKLSIQVRGEGAIRMIAADYFAPSEEGDPGTLRGYAAFDREALEAAPADTVPFSLLGPGLFAILIDIGSGRQPYQGITPIAGACLADCAVTYFAQSEQLPTRFAISMGEAQEPGGKKLWRGGGIMIQMMPKASPGAGGEGPSGPDALMAAEDILEGDEAEHWARANILLDTVEPMELVGPSVGSDALLVRLFHEESPRVFDTRALRFGCTCSAEKVRESLAAFKPEDIADMIDEEGRITADCQFCGKHYEIDPAEIRTGED